jgi:acyl dehydratase
VIVLFYEDHEVGQKATIGSHRFTRDEIVAFARDFDPQPFHVDEAAGAASIFGSLCASGWHTVSASMRVLIDYREGLHAAARARGEVLPALGLGLGVRNLRWSAPVRPNDEIVFTFEVLSARATRRPEWGVVTAGMACVNQDGREVCSYTLLSQVARRPQA